MSAVMCTDSAEAQAQVVAQRRPSEEPLCEYVRIALEKYFSQLNGHAGDGLYKMVITEVEKPLLETVLRHAGSNQTRAAQILGISRGTLRKKIAHYGLD